MTCSAAMLHRLISSSGQKHAAVHVLKLSVVSTPNECSWYFLGMTKLTKTHSVKTGPSRGRTMVIFVGCHKTRGRMKTFCVLRWAPFCNQQKILENEIKMMRIMWATNFYLAFPSSCLKLDPSPPPFLSTSASPTLPFFSSPSSPSLPPHPTGSASTYPGSSAGGVPQGWSPLLPAVWCWAGADEPQPPPRVSLPIIKQPGWVPGQGCGPNQTQRLHRPPRTLQMGEKD